MAAFGSTVLMSQTIARALSFASVNISPACEPGGAGRIGIHYLHARPHATFAGYHEPEFSQQTTISGGALIHRVSIQRRSG